MERRARAVLLATAVLLSEMLWWAWSNRPPEAVLVQTAQAGLQNIYNSVTAPGIIEATDSIAVCPVKSASVQAVYAPVGSTVEKGDLLCTLLPLPEHGIGLEEIQDIQSIWQTVTQGTDRTVTAEAATALHAPCGGVVLAMPETGDLVRPGLPCVRIADLTRLQIRVKAPELYAGELRVGQQANITASAVNGQKYAAVVKSIAPVAVRALSLTGDSGTATVEAILLLSDIGLDDCSVLRPGYSASAKIFTDYHADAVIVPLEAVCQRGEQEYVFCMQDGHAVQRAVTTGYLLERVTEITSGLDGGERVILSPPDSLTDGTPVEVIA